MISRGTLQVHGTGYLAGCATIQAAAAFFSATAFGNMNGVFKLSSIHTGPTPAVVLNRHHHHLVLLYRRLSSKR